MEYMENRYDYIIIVNTDTVAGDACMYSDAVDIAVDWKQNQPEDDVVIAVVKYEVVTDYRVEEL